MRVLLIILILASYPLRGQVIISLLLGDKLNSGKVEFGLDGGVNYPSIRGLDGGKAKSTFNIGFYFDIKMNKYSDSNIAVDLAFSNNYWGVWLNIGEVF